jgi:hypothetical protein
MTFSNHDDDRTLDAVRSSTRRMRLPPEARQRIQDRLKRGATGGTTLRPTSAKRLRRVLWAGAAVGAAVVAAAWVLPMVDRGTAMSAAEILGRSQQALGGATAGIEVLTYDLHLGGVLERMLPSGQAGRFTVEEAVDHDHPGRHRLLKLGSDGRRVAGAADDPLTGTRVHYFRVDDHGFLFRFSDVPPAPFSLVAVRRLAMQTLIGVMQGSRHASLLEIDRGGDPAYQIDVTPPAGVGGFLALERARAVVGRGDARLLDFDARGTIAAQPFAMTFSLRSRVVRSGACGTCSANA